MVLNNKKIGLDLHGVITVHPEYFKDFTNEASKREYEIHILTGMSANQAREILNNLEIVYNHVFSIFDYYEAKGKVEYLDNGDFYIDDMLWNNAKAMYCAENDIRFHIDNDAVYKGDMKYWFCLYDNKEQKCLVDGKLEINFADSFDKIFNQIDSLERK